MATIFIEKKRDYWNNKSHIYYIAKQDNFLFIEQKYGGHLGFYEGGLIYPNPLSWLDRVVVQLAESLTMYSSDVKSKAQLDLENTEQSTLGT